MRFFSGILLLLYSCISFALPKEMCFESYPEISWLATNKYVWDVNESYNHLYAYYWYHLIITNQQKDSEGYKVFQIMGHGRDRNGDEVALSGRGFEIKNHWHFEFNSMLIQSVGINGIKDLPAPPSNYPAYEVNIVWDMFNNFKTGKGYIINDIANSQSFSIEHPDHFHNDFSYITINKIGCKKWVE